MGEILKSPKAVFPFFDTIPLFDDLQIASVVFNVRKFVPLKCDLMSGSWKVLWAELPFHFLLAL